MQYITRCLSPLGGLLLAADEAGLTGLWFEGQKHFAAGLPAGCREADLPVFAQARAWLDVYFSGGEPETEVPLHLTGTAFQREVWGILRAVPYGTTVTYGEIARRIQAMRALDHAPAQAVGGAVARNPVSIIVPCHRVIGTDGSLTGYAGGLKRKAALLRLEGASLRTDSRT